MNEFYTDYQEYMHRIFPFFKVQKISINTSNGCPNRDGTLGTGGCIYCNNHSFTPSYCFSGTSVTEQLEAGKKFFRRKYKDMKYLAYFQSYTSTYIKNKESFPRIKSLFEEALSVEDVVGIVIGTRPDSINDDIIHILSTINSVNPVFLELGVETLNDNTLKLINRGHDSFCSLKCIESLVQSGLHVGVHLIAGLPGENKESIFQTIKQIISSGVESIKLHHLQVLKNTPLHQMVERGDILLKKWELDEYLDLCVELVKFIPKEVAIERFLASSPTDMVVSPKWGLKNYEFTNLLLKKLRK